MPRRLILLVASLCPWSTGCFLPWAVLALSRCPEARTHTTGDEVVAVFVRAVEEHHGTAPVPREVHTFQRVAVADGEVPAQVRAYLARGYILYLGVIADSSIRREYCLTKLYRSGYRTVVVEPGREPVDVRWESADTPAEQERAIHDLVYRVRPGHSHRDFQPNLSAGSADLRHREVLLFAAGEYARVADLYPPGSEPSKRCLREAQVLRDRAAE
jgi:hypothetical protein